MLLKGGGTFEGEREIKEMGKGEDWKVRGREMGEWILYLIKVMLERSSNGGIWG